MWKKIQKWKENMENATKLFSKYTRKFTNHTFMEENDKKLFKTIAKSEQIT